MFERSSASAQASRGATTGSPATTITVFGATVRIAGIVSSGDETDDRILIPLDRLQQLTGRPGLVDRIDVAALTKPEDDFARKDPKTHDAERTRKLELHQLRHLDRQ